MQKLLLASLFVLVLSGCVTVPNTTACTVAGTMSAGAICAETLTDKTSDLTLAQLIEMLEAGAIIQSADDWGKNKTALETACRELGSRCSYEVKKAIEGLNTPLVKARLAQ